MVLPSWRPIFTGVKSSDTEVKADVGHTEEIAAVERS
jgi:hypothetical protein